MHSKIDQKEIFIELYSRQGAHAVRIGAIPGALKLIEIAYSPDGARLSEQIVMTAEGALLVAGAIERLLASQTANLGLTANSRHESQEIKVHDSRDGNCVIVSRINTNSPWIHLLTSGGHSVGGGVSLPLELAPDAAQAIRTLCGARGPKSITASNQE